MLMPIVGAVAGVAAMATLLTALFLRRRMRLHQRAKLSDVAQPASAALSTALFTPPSAEEANGERQSEERPSGERPSGERSSWADRSMRGFSFRVRSYSNKNLNVAKFEMKRHAERRSENLSEAGEESALGDMSVSTSAGMTEGSLAAGRRFIPNTRKSSHALASEHVQEAPPSRRRGSTGALPEPQVLPLLTCSFTYSLAHSLTHLLLTHSLACSLTHSLARPLAHLIGSSGSLPKARVLPPPPTLTLGPQQNMTHEEPCPMRSG